MTAPSLLSRLRAAAGPSRELDAEVARACGWEVRTEDCIWWDVEVRAPGSADVVELPRFTDDLNAAVSLVPEGHSWAVECHHDHGSYAVVQPDLDGEELAGEHVRGAGVATPALALCMAALAARGVS